MSLFGRVTQGDIEEIRHAMELLNLASLRLQAVTKAQAARNAGFNRRLSVIEGLIRDAPVIPETEAYEYEDTEDSLDSQAKEEQSEEERRLRLGRGQPITSAVRSAR
jgi:hypothetical protein